MAIRELDKVTRALLELIKAGVDEFIGVTVDATAAPPDKVETPSNVVSMYLFHMMEDPYYKNQPPPLAGGGPPVAPVATTPLALNLFYVVTAHHSISGSPGGNTLQQQLLMGAAAKVLHDHPVITDNTVVNGVTIFDPAGLSGLNARIQIVFRPQTPEDSINFWSTEQDELTRLSGYYEVRVVFMQPEDPDLAAAGLVLSVGTYVFPNGAPQIACTRSRLGFQLPASISSDAKSAALSPARVALLGTGPIPVPPALPDNAVLNNQIRFEGSAMVRDGTQVVLRNEIWAKDDPALWVTVDRVLNDTWYSDDVTTGTEVQIRVRESVITASGSFTVLPGVYNAALDVSRIVTPQSGSPKTLVTRSNVTGIMIGPQFIRPTETGGVVTLEIIGTYLFETGVRNPDLEIQIVVAGVVALERPGPGDVLEYEVATASTISVFLTPVLAAELATNGFLPVRVLMNGAEAPPMWVEATSP